MAECPCKQKLTDGEKKVLNFGLADATKLLKNPNAAAIDAAKSLGGKNATRLAGLITQTTSTVDPTTGLTIPGPLASALPALSKMQNALSNQVGIVNAFENECNRLTNPQELMSTISSLNLFAEMNCALGIEGLDITAGLSVINGNGMQSIQFAANANIDLEKVLNNFSDGLGTDAVGAISSLQSSLDYAASKMDEVNAGLNSITKLAGDVQLQAANFIQKYTDISSISSLINFADSDPCFKLGGAVTGGLVSNEFLNTVRSSAVQMGGESYR